MHSGAYQCNLETKYETFSCIQHEGYRSLSVENEERTNYTHNKECKNGDQIEEYFY